jgi:hypothetical protein
MPTADVMTSANENTLRAVNFTQDTFLRLYKAVATRIPTTLTPSWLTPDPERSRQVIEEAFKFQSDLLQSRKAFALGLLEVGQEADAADSEAAKKASPSTKK